ncbi:TlpA disulfide reductase family protein [Aliiroseovarius subalbicans]|uniref:TlpA disulfide reductase family protein n=1 Tax=Aliiroseovarius subalbicans TaxID=2925840 RepID=UPI001F5723CE|nr:TlpA disulfide reductase family protein [Aliiroseovarius subalbicans]MCI2399546.1 TlpA family protein disulfide reductase [Aliiroseovarius subalbicans]
MSFIRSALLYTALVLGANTALADGTDLEALRDGSLKKLNIHSETRAAGTAVFTDAEGGEHTLAEYQGQVVLLNFWATWCAPCRKEMPGLNALQVEMGGEDFQVVPIATGRNKLPAIRRFFDDVDVTDLPILLDPKQALARDMAVLGLPVTVILDRDGREVARLTGDAEWDSDSAKAILQALIDAPYEG